jgi:hypothetical protein
MRNKILDSFAINFIENHFDEINIKECEWNVKTKNQAIKEIKKHDYMAGWVITEVMKWGTPIDYIKQYIIENDDDKFIIKIDSRYFSLDYENAHYFKEVFPKKIMIEKLIFDELP